NSLVVWASCNAASTCCDAVWTCRNAMRPAQIARNGIEIIAIQNRRSSQRSISFIDTVAGGHSRGSRSCTFSRVLPACRELPRRRAAEERDELAPLHVLPSDPITSL